MRALINAASRGTEHGHQATFTAWVRQMAKQDYRYENVFAIPNAGKRSLRAAHYYKAEGLEPGVPDVCVAWPSPEHHGLFIEFKRSCGVVSKAQHAWHERLRRAGYRVEIAFSVDEAIKLVESYLGAV